MMRSRPAFPFIVVAALVLGACSSGDSSNGDPTVPIPTAATSLTSTTSADSTTTSTGSASSDASTSTTSSSMMPSEPTPAAARYISAGLPRPPAPTTKEIGRLFLGQSLLPFEAASVLLLVALIGAAMIVRRRRDA